MSSWTLPGDVSMAVQHADLVDRACRLLLGVVAGGRFPPEETWHLRCGCGRCDYIVVHTSLPPANVHASLPPANVHRKYPDISSLCVCSELVRYRQFLGIQKEQQNIKEEQEKLKNSFAAGKDIVSPDNLNTISQAKAEGTPADRYPEALCGVWTLTCTV